MKLNSIIFCTLLFLSLSLVSGYSRCDGEWCCDDSSHVICDRDAEICGSKDWCDNYNDNGMVSCIPGDDWCCYDEGYVADYNARTCCPPEYPFYIPSKGLCGNYDSGQAVNYYTNLFECEYFHDYDTGRFTVESGCVGHNAARCSFEISDKVAYWQLKDTEVGVCGYVECNAGETKCEGSDFINCNNGKWTNIGVVVNECGVECVSDTDCPEDTEVNSVCVDGQLNVNVVDYFCSDNNGCDKKPDVKVNDIEFGVCGVECVDSADCGEDTLVNTVCLNGKNTTNYLTKSCKSNVCESDPLTVSDDLAVGICGVECFIDSDCGSKTEIANYCVEGKVNINYEIETCENYQCIPNSITESSKLLGECGLDCSSDADCANEIVTGKYWKDGKLYQDVINEECENNMCTAIIDTVDLGETFEPADLNIDDRGDNAFWKFIESVINWFGGLF